MLHHLAVLVVSKYSQPCGFRNSTFVSRAPGYETVLFSSNVPAPWCANVGTAMAMAAINNRVERSMGFSSAISYERTASDLYGSPTFRCRSDVPADPCRAAD